jgi:ribosomal protein L32
MSNNSTSYYYLPDEIKRHILSFIPYAEIARIVGNRNVFYDAIKNITVPICYKMGAYNNINDMCFYCPTHIGSNYNINMCRCRSALIPLKVGFGYPSVCTGCTRKISRGEQMRALCRCCGKQSMHIGIVCFSQ